MALLKRVSPCREYLKIVLYIPSMSALCVTREYALAISGPLLEYVRAYVCACVCVCVCVCACVCMRACV